MVWGVPDGVSMLALKGWLAEGRRLVYVARDDARMMAMRDAMARLIPSLPVHVFPAWDCLPYDRLSPQNALVGQRVETLARLAEGDDPDHGGALLVTTVNALLQRVPGPDYFADRSLILAAGESSGPARLADFLSGQGYLRTDTVRETGEFALRGGILDIFPPGHETPVRLDFFGDELETLRAFDAATQRGGARIERLVLRPVAEFQLDDAAVERFRTGYRAAFGALASRDALYESVSAGRMHPGAEHWLPLFHESLARLTDYCPQWQLVLDHEADAAIGARLAQIGDFFVARRDSADEDGSMAYRPLPEDRLYLDADELDALLASAARLMPYAAPPEDLENDKGGNDAGGRAGIVLANSRTSQSVMGEIAGIIAEERAGQGRSIVIAGAGDGAMARLEELAAAHLGVEIRHPDSLDDLVAGAVHLIDWPLDAGFQTDRLLVITETDIFGQRLSRPRSRRGRGEDFLREVSALEEGDLVVHAEHGIGRYEGLVIIDSSGGPHDCLQLVYAGGDKLYLPVENIEILSRYGSAGTDAQLDRLGGAAWQARVARIKGRVRIMAEQLINIAAQRQTARAEALQPEAGSFAEFCARFGFVETDDQLGAIEDVVGDLASGRATDRLICGDVGFGKTEVAVRAIFTVSYTHLTLPTNREV